MKRIFTALIVVVFFVSCERFVEIDTPKTQIVNAKVFENDAGARSAIAGIYSQMMMTPTFASGGRVGVTTIGGLSADELANHSTTPNRIAIFSNNLTPLTTVSSIWTECYQAIYGANAILEGLERSTTLSSAIKDQVTGQALFMRAFGYFYLVNFYGDVPLLLSTDYRVNREALRTPVDQVYEQIEDDLLRAQSLLLADYSFSNHEKVSPNKWAATALLARTYLFEEKWADAETQATSIIEDGQFSLMGDLNSVFLANSEEAIWQLMPVLPGMNTFDGTYFFGEYGIVDVSVSPSIIDAFESGDNRRTAWIGTAASGDLTYDYAYKYKVLYGDQPLSEYQMVFRLAEQYLIRAEARTMINDLSGAIDDVNAIRSRAGLDPIIDTGLTQPQVLDLVEQERKVELFIEWGHRWFDLKRWGSVDSVLGPLKPDWQSKDALFPIPQSEINANPNLTQNP